MLDKTALTQDKHKLQTKTPRTIPVLTLVEETQDTNQNAG
jgi:hypothetical protein